MNKITTGYITDKKGNKRNIIMINGAPIEDMINFEMKAFPPYDNKSGFYIVSLSFYAEVGDDEK